MSDQTWTVRVRAAGDREVVAHSGTHSIRVGKPLSFQPDEPLPTALELFLSAFGADLVGGLQLAAKRRRIQLDAVECSLNCTLENPLTHIGVVGEEGNPGIRSLDGSMYVSGEFDGVDIDQMWAEVIDRSPLASTLRQKMNIKLSVV